MAPPEPSTEVRDDADALEREGLEFIRIGYARLARARDLRARSVGLETGRGRHAAGRRGGAELHAGENDASTRLGAGLKAIPCNSPRAPANEVAARIGDPPRGVAAGARVAEGLLNAQDAAALLGVSASTFRDVVRPELPTVRIGRRVAFDRKDVERWALEHKVGGSSDFPRDETRTSSASAMLDAATKSPRAEEIRRKLLSKPRGSTRT